MSIKKGGKAELNASKQIGFAIVGCGTISDWHAKAAKEAVHAHLVGAYDQSPERTRAFCQAYGIRAFSSMEELLSSPEVEAVCLCTPSGYHTEGALSVIAAGRHVLVEKPLALTVSDCDRIIEAARDAGVTVGVVSQHRFTPAMDLLRELLQTGKLGRIVSVDLSMKYYRSQEYYDSGHWRGTWALDGGGALMNQGIHGIDTMLYLVGDVKCISGYARTLARNIEVEDTAVAAFELENGALGTLQGTTSVSPGYPRELTISGTSGTVTILDNKTFTRWDVEGCPLPEGICDDSPQRSSAKDPRALGVAGHIAVVEGFARAILFGDPIPVSAEDGRRAVELIAAIYRSSDTHAPVTLE